MRKRLIVGSAIFLVVGAIGFFFLIPVGKPSRLLDFHPNDFAATASEPIFFSVGRELRYSANLDQSAPTIYGIRNRISSSLVSPDGRMLAFVDDNQLYIVSSEGAVHKIVGVDSIYHGDFIDNHHDKKPIGRDFFRDSDFQWSKDSRALYLIHDQFYESKGSQLYSEHGELWKYDLGTGKLGAVLKPFKAYQFFFGRKGIYYSVPTSTGDLQLVYFDGVGSNNIGTPNDHFTESNLLKGKPDSVFYTFPLTENSGRAPLGRILDVQQNTTKTRRYSLAGRTLFSATEGQGFKGPYYCPDFSDGTLLPGNRYLLADLHSCEPYKGDILLDTSSGEYKELPKDVEVYRTSNTNEMHDFGLSGGGITAHPVLLDILTGAKP